VDVAPGDALDMAVEEGVDDRVDADVAHGKIELIAA
jgi:hypothetical protein